MDGKGRSQSAWIRAERDHGVPRRSTNALANTVQGEDGSSDTPTASYRQQAELADSRKRVSPDRNFLLPAPAVRGNARNQAQGGHGGALINAVQNPELQRAEFQIDHEIK